VVSETSDHTIRVTRQPILSVNRVTWREVGLVAIVFALISAASAIQQEARWRPVLEGDALEYFEMTRQFHAGETTVRATGPFVYRVGVPWLASRASAEQIDAYTPFYLINICSAFAVALLLLVWLQRFVVSPGIRVLLVAAYVAAWHAPARFVYFYPVYVDPPFLACMLTALVLMDRRSDDASIWRRVALLVTIVAGTLVRESMAIVAVAAAAAPVWPRRGAWPAVAWRLAPIAAAAGALLVSHHVGILRDPYSPFTEPRAMLATKPLAMWLLGWFFAFGPPIIALIAANDRGSLAIVGGRPHVALFFLGCVAASFFGGTDTERIAAWAAPVVYAAAGVAIERFRWSAGWVVIAILAVTQAISARIFWPIPSVAYNVGPYVWTGKWQEAYEAFNRLVVIHTHYTYLWSSFGSRAWHTALLAFDLAFVALVVWWIRKRSPTV
jgi:hypothetical protein